MTSDTLLDESDIQDDWTVLGSSETRPRAHQPTCKSNPAPAPIYRFSLNTPRAQWTGHSPVVHSAGLPAPSYPSSWRERSPRSEAHRGLDAPQLTNHTPRSLNPCENLQAVTHAKPCQTSALALQGPATVEVPLQFPAVQKRRGMDAVVRY